MLLSMATCVIEILSTAVIVFTIFPIFVLNLVMGFGIFHLDNELK